MIPVIVCIAKKEQDYIKEFIDYHLGIGFKKIYLYDNEDEPFYETYLNNKNVIVTHMPFNNYHKGVQYIALDHFVSTYMKDATHVAHIDIDEFIVLKKHKNIEKFINEYIVGDCQGIGINWRFFGSSGHTEKKNEPNTQRFTMCEEKGDKHIKTLFKTKYFNGYGTVHHVYFTKGYNKSTNGHILKDSFNEDIDLSVIQLNHYKCKTLPEFRIIRQRGRADIGNIPENVDEDFKVYDKNEVEDLTAKIKFQYLTNS
jgi:hypothetical protein